MNQKASPKGFGGKVGVTSHPSAAMRPDRKEFHKDLGDGVQVVSINGGERKFIASAGNLILGMGRIPNRSTASAKIPSGRTMAGPGLGS